MGSSWSRNRRSRTTAHTYNTSTTKTNGSRTTITSSFYICLWPMPLSDMLPKVPDQPIPYWGLINPRPLDIRLLGTLPGYDNHIDDEKKPEVSIGQPDKTMYRKFRKLFDEIQDEMIFRKHLPRQLEINKFLESLKRKVIHDYDIPISIKELRAEYEKSPFFKDIYIYITKGHIPSQIRGHAWRKSKTECEDYLVNDNVFV